MSLLFDRNLRIASPTLAPAQLPDAGERRRRRNRDAELTIALINNRPDTALKATERQFMHLLNAAAGNTHIHFHRFSLPSVNRFQTAKRHVDSEYRDIGDLGRLQIDGLIVTGAEPNAPALSEEPFWQDLTDVIDWAKTNTRSTIWS